MPFFPLPDRVEQLFDAALQLPHAERAVFLKTECGSDTAQFGQITALLTASEQADDYFTQLGTKLGLKSVFAGDLELPQSKTIGPYKLIRLIGRGGMGAVYLAERADEQFEKDVALKILPIGVGGETARHRFIAERQILARLVHPNIARLLDGGIGEHDTPYFVMDYIDGIPIDEYCDRQRLDIDGRIRLFMDVAGAVEYAHRNLVVHRDIKPGNVLVQADGSALLVDFGIAKLLDTAVAETSLTIAGQQPMTVLYSSPEAVRGEPVTTAMDIYSLGVLLYRLVCGCYPCQIDINDTADVRHQILDSPQQSASRALMSLPETDAGQLAVNRSMTVKSLVQTLRGDLDTILGKALAKETGQRYATVEQFMADLRRYDQQMPVLAQPPSLAYRLGKYVRRRKTLVIAGATVFLSLLALAAMTVRYTIETRQQAMLIAQERDKAVQISEFLVTIFKSTDPIGPQGKDVMARVLLDRSAEQIEDKLSDQPEVHAALSRAIGEAYSNLSMDEAARRQFENALRAYEQVGQNNSIEYASTLFRLSHATERIGDYLTAESLAQRGVDLNERIGNPAGLANSLDILARIRQRQGQTDGIESLYSRALNLRREVYGDQHVLVAASLHSLGSLFEEQHQFDRALVLHQEGLEIKRSVLSEGHPSLIESLYNLGAVSRRLGRFDEAQANFLEALSILNEVFPEGAADEAFMYSGLGHIYRELGEPHKAADSFRQGAAVIRRILGDQHPNLGIMLANLGAVLVRQGNCKDAVSILDESEEIVSLAIPKHRAMITLRISRGICMKLAGDYVAAEQLLLEGYYNQVERYGANTDKAYFAADQLAQLYSQWGKPTAAERFERLARVAQ